MTQKKAKWKLNHESAKRGRLWRKIGIAVVLAMVIAGASVFCYVQYAPIAWVNGHAIDRRTLQFYMDSYRALTITHFQSQYGAVYDSSFWTTPYGGQTPLRALKDKSLASLEQDTVSLIFANELGLDAPLSYKAFEREFKQKNAQRQQTVNSGGVIYGPKQYTESVYYFYMLDNAKTNSLYAMNDRMLHVTENEINSYYEQIKDTQFRNIDLVDVLWISAPEDASTDDRNMITQMKDDLDQNRDMTEVRQKIADANSSITCKELTYGGDGAKGQAMDDPDRYSAAFDLTQTPGFTGDWLDYSGQTGFLVFVSRESTGYIPLSDCRDNVLKALLQSKYDDYLARRVADAKIKLNNLALNMMGNN